jgi:hypothetical protein
MAGIGASPSLPGLVTKIERYSKRSSLSTIRKGRPRNILSKSWPAPFGANGACDWGNAPFIFAPSNAPRTLSRDGETGADSWFGKVEIDSMMAGIRATNQQIAEDRAGVDKAPPSSARCPL